MQKWAFLTVFLALTGLLAAPAAAEGGRAREHVRAGDVRPLDEILMGIRNTHPGTFSDAEGPFPDDSGGYRYRIKWLTPDGRVIWFDTDARTGRIMGTDRHNSSFDDERRGNWRDRDSGDSADQPDGPPERTNRFNNGGNLDRTGPGPDRGRPHDHGGWFGGPNGWPGRRGGGRNGGD